MITYERNHVCLNNKPHDECVTETFDVFNDGEYIGDVTHDRIIDGWIAERPNYVTLPGIFESRESATEALL